MKRRQLLGVLAMLALASVLGADTPKASPAAGDKEKAVRDRVAAYWKVRMTTNLQDCHPFYEASFREKYPPDTFAREFRRLNRFAPEFLGVEGVAFDAAGRTAKVKIKLRTRPGFLEGKDLDSVVEETWVQEGDGWFHAAEALLPAF